jgi:hypothetical protein
VQGPGQRQHQEVPNFTVVTGAATGGVYTGVNPVDLTGKNLLWP